MKVVVSPKSTSQTLRYPRLGVVKCVSKIVCIQRGPNHDWVNIVTGTIYPKTDITMFEAGQSVTLTQEVEK